MSQEHIAILVSLDFKGAFEPAWLPTILKTLREFNCPKNVYNLTKWYLSERRANFTTSVMHTEREVTKGCPQDSCFGPGFWNFQYNSLLNIEFGK